MKKIVVFGASASTQSINQQLAKYAANLLNNVEVNLLDLNAFEMPIFNVDREKESGVPQEAHDFKKHVREADGILISFAEHNGSYTAAFKNIMDWASRAEKDLWMNKPMFLLATSPGGRGGQSVLGLVNNDFPHRGGRVIASFSLPSFRQNFSEEKGITDIELENKFKEQLELFQGSLEND